ncbi:hypothetical protein HOY80DRAFT_778758 [Tuber brumale]|nr:hypothetical protein HOY80DRAFT_778758 [Tuber brumale]
MPLPSPTSTSARAGTVHPHTLVARCCLTAMPHRFQPAAAVLRCFATQSIHQSINQSSITLWCGRNATPPLPHLFFKKISFQKSRKCMHQRVDIVFSLFSLYLFLFFFSFSSFLSSPTPPCHAYHNRPIHILRWHTQTPIKTTTTKGENQR